MTNNTDKQCYEECVGMASKTHEEIVIKLARIEAGQLHITQNLEVGQQHITRSLAELSKALTKISIQEERQVQQKAKIDAAWVKIDTLKEAHDRCPIKNIKAQLNWLWLFLSSLAVSLVILSAKVILNLPLD